MFYPLSSGALLGPFLFASNIPSPRLVAPVRLQFSRSACPSESCLGKQLVCDAFRTALARESVGSDSHHRASAGITSVTRAVFCFLARGNALLDLRRDFSMSSMGNCSSSSSSSSKMFSSVTSSTCAS